MLQAHESMCFSTTVCQTWGLSIANVRFAAPKIQYYLEALGGHPLAPGCFLDHFQATHDIVMIRLIASNRMDWIILVAGDLGTWIQKGT